MANVCSQEDVRFQEDQDLLERSTKKMKKPSFKDILVGVQTTGESLSQLDDEAFISDDEEVCEEDDGDDCPMIHLTKGEKG
ncbi:hypothetical protein PTKIN_Ptkin03bG0093100 [Pterospermum kingtungense]